MSDSISWVTKTESKVRADLFACFPRRIQVTILPRAESLEGGKQPTGKPRGPHKVVRILQRATGQLSSRLKQGSGSVDGLGIQETLVPERRMSNEKYQSNRTCLSPTKLLGFWPIRRRCNAS